MATEMRATVNVVCTLQMTANEHQVAANDTSGWDGREGNEAPGGMLGSGAIRKTFDFAAIMEGRALPA